MELYHFSQDKVVLDYSRQYLRRDTAGVYKPAGLWVSDESEAGWKEWCFAEDYLQERFQFQYLVELDMADILVISNKDKLLSFHRKYAIGGNYEIGGWDDAPIAWSEVKQTYKGVIITPHIRSCRLDLLWYYGWDCASGCIWDLSAVTKFEMVSP